MNCFTGPVVIRTRDNGFRLKEGGFSMHLRKTGFFWFFLIRMVKHWNTGTDIPEV